MYNELNILDGINMNHVIAIYNIQLLSLFAFNISANKRDS
jgi:hypothetical protein